MSTTNIIPLTIDPIPQPGPDGWKWHKLNKIAKLESGHTPSRARPDWWGGDVAWLALPDIRKLDGQYADETLEYTNAEGLANSSARLLPKGTVCLSRTASVGYVTILNRPMATSQDFVNWICGPDLHPEFLMYTLLASRDYIRSLSSGAIHKTVYVPTVKDFQVCAPALAEQKRITAKLRYHLNNTEIAKVAAEKQLAALGLCRTNLLKAFLTSHDAKSWDKKPLSELAIINPTRRLVHENDNEEATSFIPMASICAMTGRIEKLESRPFGDVKRGYTYVEEADVLFAKITPCMQNGKHAVAEGLSNQFAFASTEFHVIRPLKGVIPQWIHAYLRQPSVLHEASKAFTGAVGQQRVPKSFLQELPIPVPPLSEQIKITNALLKKTVLIERLQLCADKQLAAINALPASILRQAFSGQL